MIEYIEPAPDRKPEPTVCCDLCEEPIDEKVYKVDFEGCYCKECMIEVFLKHLDVKGTSGADKFSRDYFETW